MDLKSIKGIGPSKQEKLKAAGITTVEQLARAEVTVIATKTGIGADQVLELKQRAVAHNLVADLKSVGPATFATLGEEAAKNLKDVYEASIEWSEAQAKLLSARFADLRERAEAAATHIAAEAKTVEGRKVLAGEAREIAVRVADEAQVQAKKAAKLARETGEKISADVKQFQVKAPEYLGRAEAAFQDAEANLREATAKFQTSLKQQAEQARARTEQAVQNVRSRFNRAA
jgi:hypothetical protein